MTLPGVPASSADIERLARSGIPAELTAQAMLRRVTSAEGGALIGRNGSADYAGIAFPYLWPGEQSPREYRLRRDHPEMQQHPDGKLKERNKYLAPPGRGNLLYFVPGTRPEWLTNARLPAIVTEGEKKCLALFGLAMHRLGDAAENPRWLSIALSGVWNWHGTTGKTTGPDGDRRDVKGVVPDFERVAWKGRKVIIAFDTNVRDNESVRAARWELTKELRRRGATVHWLSWPSDTPDEVNGVDDFIGIRGIDAGLKLIEAAQPAPKNPFASGPGATATTKPKIPIQCFSLEDLMDDESIAIPQLAVEGLLPKAGLLLLGGRPKDGKSWLACQLALAIATGQALGGWLKVLEPGRVQLWALEDQYAITKDKMLKLLHGTRPDGLEGIKVFAELAQPILRGGDQIIHAALEAHPSELIILDSLFKLAGARQPYSDISQGDYDVIDRVRKIALQHKCAACIVMHTKKGAPGGNPIENLLGTSGIPAAADAIAELKRFKAGSGKLTVVGRSVPSENYELAWNGGPDKWGWTVEDTGDQAAAGEVSEEILDYLDGQGTAAPAAMAAALRKSFASVWHGLLRLQAKGKVVRGADKKWSLVKK